MTSLSVLLVEDNPANQAVIKAMLGRFDVNLTVVLSGELGIESAMKFNFDLILMDFQLPGLSGVEAARRIRAYENEKRFGEKKAIIIAFTAEAFKETEIDCLNAGMNGFLTKPLKFQVLIDKLAYFGIDLKNRI